MFNYYNALALAVLVLLVVSVKYAVFWDDELEVSGAGTTEVFPFEFYDTLEATTVSTTVTRRTSGKSEWLQVGAFSQEQNAVQQMNRIRNIGIDATVEIGAEGHYIVYIGPFGSRSLVQDTKQSLVRAGLVAHSVWR